MANMNSGKKAPRDCRIIVFSCVAAYMAVMLFAEFHYGTYGRIIKSLGIFPIPYFIDLQALLTGLDAVRSGLDPYCAEANVRLAYGSYNYPAMWTWLSVLPFLKVANSFILGVILLVAFFTALYFFIGRISLFESIAYCFIIISPAVMLGVERGNCDLIVFLLLLVPVFCHYSPNLLAASALLAGMLKIFPISAIMGLAYHFRNSKKQTVFLFVTAVIFFLAYLFIMKENILTVHRTTPKPHVGFCFGLGVLPALLQDCFPDARDKIWLPYLASLPAGVVLFYFLARKNISALNFSCGKFGIAHIIGSAIFITACMIGYNWEYRLVFLLLAMPQTLTWARAKNMLPAVSLVLTIAVIQQSFIEMHLPVFFHEFLFNHFSIPYFVISQFLVMILFFYHTAIVINFSLRTVVHR